MLKSFLALKVSPIYEHTRSECFLSTFEKLQEVDQITTAIVKFEKKMLRSLLSIQRTLRINTSSSNLLNPTIGRKFYVSLTLFH